MILIKNKETQKYIKLGTYTNRDQEIYQVWFATDFLTLDAAVNFIATHYSKKSDQYVTVDVQITTVEKQIFS